MNYILRQMVYCYAALSFILFFLSCVFLISSLSLALSTILVIAIFAFSIYQKGKRDLEFWPQLLSALRNKYNMAYLLMGFIAVFFSLRTPPFVIDDLVYHLQVPKMILQNSGFVFDSFNINSNFPMLFEMPLLVFLQFFDFLNPSLLSCLAGLGLVLVLKELGRIFFQIKESVLLGMALCLMTSPIFFKSILCSYVELFMTFVFLLAIESYLTFQKDRTQKKYWLEALILMGFLCSIKYLGLMYFFLFCVYEFFYKKNNKLYYAGLTLGLLFALPWYLKNYIYTGNPIFPLFHYQENPFISIDRLNIYNSLFKDFHMGRGFWDYVLLPFRILWAPEVNIEGGRLGFGGKMSFLFLLSFLSLWNWKKPFGLISFMALTYFVFWSLSSQQVRFLLPVFIPSLLIGLSFFNGHKKIFSPILKIAFVLIMLQNMIHLGMFVEKEKLIRLYTFQEDSAAFLIRRLPDDYAFVSRLNKELDPRKNRVLSIGFFGKNYYFTVPVKTATYYESEVLSLAFKKDDFDFDYLFDFYKQEEITHIMIDLKRLDMFYEDQENFDLIAMHQYLLQQKIILKEGSLLLLELKPLISSE